jgi:hypothetical protein
MPTDFPISLGAADEDAEGTAPMSAAAMPGSFVDPIGSTKRSVPSSPRCGCMPKWIRLSQ